MTDHTAPDLLEAVGVDWREEWYRVQCPECTTRNAMVYHENKCRRPDTSHIARTYTGPALGTPDLDALLLVAGQRWLLDHEDKVENVAESVTKEQSKSWFANNWAVWLLVHNDLPGHALARAIAEVGR